MSKKWSSPAIHLPEGVCTDVQATQEGLVLGVLVGMVLSVDLHMQPDVADRLAAALTTGAQHCRAMRNR